MEPTLDELADRLVAEAGFDDRASALAAAARAYLVALADRSVARSYAAARPDLRGDDVIDALVTACAEAVGAEPLTRVDRQLVSDADGRLWDLTPRAGEDPSQAPIDRRRSVGVDLTRLEDSDG